MQELRTGTDLTLGAAKVMVRAMGRTMSTLVVQERHLWLNLAQMRDAEKVRFLNASILQGGLCGDVIEDFSHQFSEVKKQTETIWNILSRLDPATYRPLRSRAAFASHQPQLSLAPAPVQAPPTPGESCRAPLSCQQHP